MPVPLKMGDPKRLGDYELSGRLGEGGQGVVYLGTLGEESFAVKLLHGPVGDEQAAFLREVELAKHVARFCTAQVVDAGFDDGRPYIVSEYVDGPSLSREVALAGPRSGGALERLAVGTATALAAIHRAGIVHRDFKPQNVLLGPDGPRVIDFGLAKALDAAATVSGRGVGTPAYMAPEQITASAITGAVDVFSWGATMCFAANASAPFGQDSVAPVLHRILTAEPELGRLDGRLGALVEHCLDKDPRNRPTSRELLLALLGAGDEVPAEVLRSPPPHILRVDPYPLAEPEATGAAEGYLLPESRGRVRSGASQARASRSARGSGSPAVRSDPRGSVVPWPRVPGDDGGTPRGRGRRADARGHAPRQMGGARREQGVAGRVRRAAGQRRGAGGGAGARAPEQRGASRVRRRAHAGDLLGRRVAAGSAGLRQDQGHPHLDRAPALPSAVRRSRDLLRALTRGHGSFRRRPRDQGRGARGGVGVRARLGAFAG
ncbi:serine/threonine-protein kinase [Nonomuraea recticatena]|uniref:serine/threonine-protein kinase n=1 Tax=Nonomuraea recticatena TaxID=46178 RepID=UPI003616E7A9